MSLNPAWYLCHWNEYDHEPIPAFDLPLFRKAIDWVRTEAALPVSESQWNQGQWISPKLFGESCGTAYCVAGYVAYLSGFPIGSGSYPLVSTDLGSESIPGVARRLLGLTDEEAEALFGANNGIGEIEAIAAAICQRRGVEL